MSDRLGGATTLVDQLSHRTNRLDINALVKQLPGERLGNIINKKDCLLGGGTALVDQLP